MAAVQKNLDFVYCMSMNITKRVWQSVKLIKQKVEIGSLIVRMCLVIKDFRIV